VPVDAGVAPSPVRSGFAAEDVLPVSVFLLIQIKRRAGAVCRAGPSVLRAPFQPTSFGRRLRNGRIRRSVIPPRLMSRGSGPEEARRLQESNVRSLARTRFEPNLNGRAPALRSCGVCNASLFSSLSLRFPSIEAKRPLVGAHPRAAIKRSLEHNTNRGRLSRQFARW
jgi:hypothetical protein